MRIICDPDSCFCTNCKKHLGGYYLQPTKCPECLADEISDRLIASIRPHFEAMGKIIGQLP